MALTSLQVCMDSSDWLQGTIHEETGMDSSSSPSGEMLACSRPLMAAERRLRPPQDQALKCPRCDSTHTKFCYYNNYSLSQPRYFCKTCRRYWTKGGTLRNIPVGGGCRKNKKSSKKSSSTDNNNNNNPQNPINSSTLSSNNNDHHLQLSFPHDMHFSQLNSYLANHATSSSTLGFVPNPSLLLENPTPIDFMENKYEGFVGSHDFMGINSDFAMLNNSHAMVTNNLNGIVSPFFGMSLDHHGNNAGMMTLDNCHRLMLPYESQNEIDVKPNTKVLSLDWNEDAAKESSFGYLGGLGTWSGLMNGYGSSATNPLV